MAELDGEGIEDGPEQDRGWFGNGGDGAWVVLKKKKCGDTKDSWKNGSALTSYRYENEGDNAFVST